MRRTIQLLALWNFLTDFSLFAPVAILYFARVSGSFALGMSIFSIVFLASAILEIPTGIFADKIGRKQTMLAGTLMGVTSAVFYALGFSYWWLVAGAVFEGAARSFYSGNNDAYLHDILADHGQEHKFHHYLGKVGAMFSYALRESSYQFRAAFVSSLWPVWALGISSVLANIGATISFYFSGKIIHRFKEYFSIVASDLICHILHFTALLFPSVFSPLLMASSSLTYGVKSVSKDTLYQKQFSEQYRATMGSLSSLGGSLMMAVFSLGLGILGDHITPLKGLLIFQMLSIAPSIVFFSLFWKQRES
jgi:MFS family permease